MEVGKDLKYVEHPVKILDRKEQVKINKGIPLDMVLWRNHSLEEATWKCEDEIMAKYPYLF